MKVEIANVQSPERSRTLEFLLDRAAIRSVVSRDVLAELGITPYIDDVAGQKRAMALFKYRDQVGIGDVLFGEPGDAAVIGWLTLASLGFELDPATGQLMPLPMLLV